MIVVPITNHVQQALDRLLQEYKNRPLLASLITSLVTQIQDLEDTLFDVNSARQIFNAVGAQLDGIGEIVGISRNGLTDAEYYIFILGAIGENFSDSTIPALANIISTLFGTQLVLIFEMFPAEINVQVANSNVEQLFMVSNPPNPFVIGDESGMGNGLGFGDALNPATGGVFVSAVETVVSFYPIIASMIQASLGAGIDLGSITNYDSTNAFVMGDINGVANGGGFGDALDASVGGLFASAVYTNSAA